jgi:tetratricopeptide (TPR) repeat protein
MAKAMKNGAVFLGCTLLMLIWNCSTKKDTFLNRTGHAMSTKYNVIYNGNIAFEEAKKQLDDSYEDNFWERLPIEPLEIEEDRIPLPGQQLPDEGEATGFEKAEEKAVKSVQKHSMVIDGLERNNQIDEAYLLLGKSRYYLQRFVPALEAFNFGIENYPNASRYRETKIWKAKAHVRLQNEELAIETLRSVLRSPELTELEYERAHTAMAMAYTQLDSTHRVVDHLKKSTLYFEDPGQGARNLFILGQIYREENKIDSSNMVFDALTYMKKIPRKYQVHAAIERAKNYSEADSTAMIVYTLQDLIEDRDNRPYLDELYYMAGMLALAGGNEDRAENFLELSLRKNTRKPFQKSMSYEQMGELYFNRNQFELAGAYYDSLLQIPIDKNTRRMRRIIRKRESLNDVILYEGIAKTNDSILSLTEMSEEDQDRYFNAYIEDLKAKMEAQRMLEEQNQASLGLGTFTANAQNYDAGGKFYFYNPQVVGIGKQQFQVKYGQRPYGDFWLISQNPGISQGLVSDENEVQVDTSALFSVDFYKSQIPTSRTEIDSIRYLRNDAYYNLGLIYKEQFGDYPVAAENFENFLEKDPIENLILPAKYHLYKTYANFDEQKSNKYREEIVSNYPDSRYAEIIRNPKSLTERSNDEDSPESIYKSAFICYEEEEYQYALTTVNGALEQFQGQEIEAKLELLKAFLLLKTDGEEAFENKLNDVIINYPNTEESDHAEAALEKLNQMTEIQNDQN